MAILNYIQVQKGQYVYQACLINDTIKIQRYPMGYSCERDLKPGEDFETIARELIHNAHLLADLPTY